jgi:hypothetical protein
MLCQRCTIIGITENVLGVLTGISNFMRGLSAEAKALETSLGRVGASFQSFAAVGGALAAGSGAAMASVERGDGKVHIPVAGGSLSETAKRALSESSRKAVAAAPDCKTGRMSHFLAPLGPTVRRAPLPLSWQAGRMQFGSDRGHRRRWRLETLQARSTPDAGHGI